MFSEFKKGINSIVNGSFFLIVFNNLVKRFQIIPTKSDMVLKFTLCMHVTDYGIFDELTAFFKYYGIYPIFHATHLLDSGDFVYDCHIDSIDFSVTEEELEKELLDMTGMKEADVRSITLQGG
ncbi:MAG: hypothetical protein ACFFD4_36275 [Candidatus Odinarchaeota archaeon]